MNTPAPDFTALEPFRIVRSAAETDGACVRAEAVVRPLPGASDDTWQLPHRRWFEEAGATRHIHPTKRERIEVLDGTYHVRIGRGTQVLGEGDHVDIPPNTRHAHWNGTERPVRIAVEHRPGTHSDKVFEALYRLAQRGEARPNGLPTPLQMAVIAAAYPDVVYAAWLPVPVQRLLNRLVAPLGRRVVSDHI